MHYIKRDIIPRSNPSSEGRRESISLPQKILDEGATSAPGVVETLMRPKQGQNALLAREQVVLPF
jgi:hypothetical protein